MEDDVKCLLQGKTQLPTFGNHLSPPKPSSRQSFSTPFCIDSYHVPESPHPTHHNGWPRSSPAWACLDRLVTWLLSSSTSKNHPSDDEQEIRQALFANAFSTLQVHGEPQDSDQDHNDNPAPKTASASTPRRKQSRPGKGKKGKRKTAKKQPKAPHVREADLDDVPLESYRIIESEDGVMTEYLMAVYALVREWADLRNYLQDVWMDVAYNDLNSAVAGTLSNIAVGMLRRTDTARDARSVAVRRGIPAAESSLL